MLKSYETTSIFDFLNFSIYIFLKAPVVDAPEVDITNIKLSEPPNYKKGDKLATRQAYGTGRKKLRLFFLKNII